MSYIWIFCFLLNIYHSNCIQQNVGSLHHRTSRHCDYTNEESLKPDFPALAFSMGLCCWMAKKKNTWVSEWEEQIYLDENEERIRMAMCGTGSWQQPAAVWTNAGPTVELSLLINHSSTLSCSPSLSLLTKPWTVPSVHLYPSFLHIQWASQFSARDFVLRELC